jgi:hypothetical protein
MNTNTEGNRTMIAFYKELVRALENNELSDIQRLRAGQLYIHYMMDVENPVIDEETQQTYMMTGWYIYNILYPQISSKSTSTGTSDDPSSNINESNRAA